MYTKIVKSPSKTSIRASLLTRRKWYIAPKSTPHAKIRIWQLIKKPFKRMNTKICIHCKSYKVIKKGLNHNIQRWKCKNCNKIFQANRKALPTKEELFYSFAFHKQTLKELSTSYHIRHREVQRAIDEFVLPTMKNLWWKFDREETKSAYIEGKLFLESKGYIIKGVVADGLPLIRAVFKHY